MKWDFNILIQIWFLPGSKQTGDSGWRRQWNQWLCFKTGLFQPIGDVTPSTFLYSQWFKPDHGSTICFTAAFLRNIDIKKPLVITSLFICVVLILMVTRLLCPQQANNAVRLEPLGLLYAGRESRSVVLSASALCHAVALCVTHSNRAAGTLRWSALLKKKKKNQLTGGKQRPHTLASGTAHLAFEKGLGANVLTRLFGVGSFCIFSHLHILFFFFHPYICCCHSRAGQWRHYLATKYSRWITTPRADVPLKKSIKQLKKYTSVLCMLLISIKFYSYCYDAVKYSQLPLNHSPVQYWNVTMPSVLFLQHRITITICAIIEICNILWGDGVYAYEWRTACLCVRMGDCIFVVAFITLFYYLFLVSI